MCSVYIHSLQSVHVLFIVCTGAALQRSPLHSSCRSLSRDKMLFLPENRPQLQLKVFTAKNHGTTFSTFDNFFSYSEMIFWILQIKLWNLHKFSEYEKKTVKCGKRSPVIFCSDSINTGLSLIFTPLSFRL